MSFFSYNNQHKQKFFVAFVKIVDYCKKIGLSARITPIIVGPLQVIRLRNVYLELRV